jgi:hypothetical protein
MALFVMPLCPLSSQAFESTFAIANFFLPRLFNTSALGSGSLHSLSSSTNLVLIPHAHAPEPFSEAAQVLNRHYLG